MIRRRVLSGAATAAAVLTLTACGNGGPDPGEGPAPPGDDPVTLTMWTRSVTAAQSEALVQEFNAAHEGRISIELTVVPHTEYLQNVSAAATGDNLPDLLAANVIDGPNYATLGLWADITDRVAALDFADTLAPAHMQVGTLDGVVHAVPHVVDVSALYFNKVLLARAGLDPDRPPTSLHELAGAAAAVDALGDDVGGLYFPGDCGGCLAFTVFPSIWAAGGTVMNEDGTEATFDSPEAVEVLSIYHDMWTDGSMMSESRNESGATQNAAFEAGTAGFALLGSKALGTIPENDGLEIGVAAIPGPDGGASTFVGGDVIGISSSSQQHDAAWEFLSWSMTEDVQLEVFAQDGFIPVRTDLADNEYAADDERVVLMNELVADGQLPYSPRFFQTFNDPQGPFLSLLRDAVFTSGPDVLPERNAAVTGSLQAGL